MARLIKDYQYIISILGYSIFFCFGSISMSCTSIGADKVWIVISFPWVLVPSSGCSSAVVGCGGSGGNTMVRLDM